MFVWFACMTSRRDIVQSFIQKFAYRNAIKLYGMLFYKSNQKNAKKTRGEIFLHIRGYDVIYAEVRNLIKTP